MRTVYKYTLTPSTIHTMMPKDAKIISAKLQHDKAVVWAVVDTDKPNEQRTLVVIPTGEPIPEFVRIVDFIDTVSINDGALIFHIFEVESNESKLGH